MFLSSFTQAPNVAFDINYLGQGYADPKNRTGIFRVVEHVAEGIVKSNFKVDFVADEYLESATAYLKSNSRLAKYTVGERNGYQTALENTHVYFQKAEQAALQRHYQRRESFPVFARMYRKILFSAHALLPPYNKDIKLDSWVLRRAKVYHSPFSGITEKVRQYTQLKCFLTVYDLIPILYPQYVNYPTDSWTHRAVGSLKPHDWAFAISEATKNDLCQYRKDLSPDRVFVTHLAASPEKFYRCTDPENLQVLLRKYQLPDQAKYFLTLSNLVPHKNFVHLLKCFNRLITEERLNDLYLILVGSTEWQFKDIFEIVNADKRLSSRVVFTGRVEDDELSPLYTGALGFVYPSLYEGFGLPPLEAMQCGVPVITSNTSSLPEVVGDAGIMVDPKDEDALCQAMLRVYGNSELRAQMAEKSLQQAAKFSWDKCVQQTIQGYQTALNS